MSMGNNHLTYCVHFHVHAACCSCLCDVSCNIGMLIDGSEGFRFLCRARAIRRRSAEF